MDGWMDGFIFVENKYTNFYNIYSNVTNTQYFWPFLFNLYIFQFKEIHVTFEEKVRLKLNGFYKSKKIY